ncbi:TPA: LPXTG cell wall anchor domain-containing protein [Streptococcus suis]|nr:LPXTG cell wall anchor domain-containing protein [Streptococcus suis]HEM5307800.1 LPXTG cell wall anchor domain-containing protein [Streptococcus suis]
MSKQKVVSSLLLSTVVLGGLAFYSTTTVKAESLETDVTSVSSGDVVEKPVVSDGEESDFLAEEELEDDETLEEELNEQAEEVAEPSSPEALLQPRAMMSDSTNSDMEEILVDDKVSGNTATVSDQVQDTNASNFISSSDSYKKSVSIDGVKVDSKEISWEVSFDAKDWSFDVSPGGFYFILPQGLNLTSIKENGETELFNQFPKEVKSANNNSGATYRFFSRKEESGNGDKDFDKQWDWSAGQVSNEQISRWKSENRMSTIYFIDSIKAKDSVTYRLTAQREDMQQLSFPLVAVMKSFKYTNGRGTQVTSLSGREIKIQEPKDQNPDSGIILKPLPKPEVPQTPKEEAPQESPKSEAPQAPSTPEKQPEAPKEEPKQDAPKEEPQVPSIPEEQPKAIPAPPAPSVPEEKPMEAPKPEAPKDTPEVSPKSEAPTEEPKKEDEPGQELPKPMEPKVDKPTPEVPKQEDVQPEAPKSDKAETDKPMPETKQPDVKQPKADDMPKEQQPKADEPKAEQPQMDKPQMEAPKKDSEAPKSDKVETDKPMPETKQPDMKQPKADKPEAEKAQMPRTEGMKPESKASMMPKAEASKTTLPNTGEASSAIGWLGGALATLVTGLYLFKNKKEE